VKFFNYIHNQDGWKSLLAIIYALICIFDFIIVPTWIGTTRKSIMIDTSATAFTSLDVQVQIQLIQSIWAEHEPFTLMGGGMFHLAFGALLTGSAFASSGNTIKQKSTDSKDTSSRY
jgi:hypothetical protein